MPEVSLEIGGRQFSVACEPGEEENVARAAELLDAEAVSLQDSIGRLPEVRMLLMAGLMLADRTADMAEHVAMADRRMSELEAKIATGGGGAGAQELLEKTAKRLERLADRAAGS